MEYDNELCIIQESLFKKRKNKKIKTFGERRVERVTWKHALPVRGGATVWGGGSIGVAEKAEPRGERARVAIWSHLEKEILQQKNNNNNHSDSPTTLKKKKKRQRKTKELSKFSVHHSLSTTEFSQGEIGYRLHATAGIFFSFFSCSPHHQRPLCVTRFQNMTHLGI